MEDVINTNGPEQPTPESETPQDEATLETTKGAKPAKVKKKRKKFYQYTLEDDIRYKAPLNFRHLRILAWVFLFLSQAGLILGLVLKDIGPEVVQPMNILSGLSALAMPLFMLANFSLILRERQTYLKLLATYAALAGLLVFVYFFFYLHIYFGVGDLLVGDRELIASSFATIVYAVAPGGFLAFNIFMDLFLCTLFAFFLSYRPRKLFKGKSIYVFRWMCLLPIIYELTTIVLKFLSATGGLMISPYLYPFLPTKPPVMFLVFIVLTLFIKNRERAYIKKGNKTHEEYNAFLGTNLNSFQFSKFTSIIFLLGALLDAALFIFVTVLYMAASYGDAAEITDIMFLESVNQAYKLGFGQTVVLVLLIPVVLLFSYTKGKKNKMLDMAVSAVGVGSIALFYFEAGFFTLLLFIGDKIGTIDIF